MTLTAKEVAFAPTTLAAALREIPRREGRGFTFVRPDRSERFFPYEELYQEAARRGHHLRGLGLNKGDRLALVCPDGAEFVLSFLGAVLQGIVPVPIYPRATFKAIDAYVDILSHVTEAADARFVLTQEATAPFVAKVEERTKAKALVTEQVFRGSPAEAPTPEEVRPDDLCFLQFTSGSTSKPKGVIVRHSNLVANASAFLGRAGLNRVDADVGVSWLPLYHDMGLIGFVLGTLICDIPVVLLPTASFARNPRLWLDAISRHRGTITFAPNFGYQLAAKRVRDRDLSELDLSSLRVAGCGAEPIRAKTLRDFAARMAPAGFRGEEVFLPSYGMAEATLAITFHPHGAPLRVDRVDPDAMRSGLATPAAAAAGSLEVVGCGVPFPGHGVRIVDEAGAPVGERQVGHVQASGPSVTDGYFRDSAKTSESFDEGWLRTGDLGYWADGHLFICGRSKDLLIIHGANHYPQDIEWAVGDLEGVRRGNVAAVGMQTDAGEELGLVVEGSSRDAERLTQEIRQLLVARFGLQPRAIRIVPVGSLPKTSSGKLQRQKARSLLEETN